MDQRESRRHPPGWLPRSVGAAVRLAAVIAIVAAGCTAAPPPLSDPREILDRAVAHLRAASSVHVEASVDGSIPVANVLGGPAASGGALGLTGTHVEGDLDLAAGRATVRFEVPALLGLTGEVRQLDGEAYLESSLTSRGWHRLPGGALPIGAGRPLEWIDGLVAWLERPATVPVRLDDAACRSGRCYVVRIQAGAADLGALASAAPDLGASLREARLGVDLRIDRSSLVLSEAIIRLEPPGGGSIEVSMAFSAWGGVVHVEAPAPSELASGPLLP